MTPKHNTLVTFLLDRTQSMSKCRDETIEAFNTYLKSLKEDKGDGFNVEFTFLQFDSISLDKLAVAEPVKNVAPLNTKTFVPRGMTPLIDACVKTIKAVESALTKRDDKPKVVVCFQTDGEENCSHEYKWHDLNTLIKDKTAEGWEFVFMGAGIDSYVQASMMGIGHANTVSYDHLSGAATTASFAAAASNTRGFGTGAKMNMAYTAHQKMQSGDKFDKSLQQNASLVDDFNLDGNT